jgi:hypothetical protein
MENLSRLPLRCEHRGSACRGSPRRQHHTDVPSCRVFRRLLVRQNRSFGIGGKGSRDAGSASIHTVTSKIWCGMHQTHLLNMALGERSGAPGTLAIMGQIMYALTANQKTRSARKITTLPSTSLSCGETNRRETGGGRRSAGIGLVTCCNEVSTW